MNIGITGVSGFVGIHLAALARSRGHRVIGFSRRRANVHSLCDERRTFGTGMDFTGCDAVIHLAGETVTGRWTSEKKHRIRESRVRGTRLVVDSLSQMREKPALIAASAIGWYGETGDEPVDETAPCASDFLGEVCAAWEEEALVAEKAGCRLVRVRISVVLGPDGGALKAMLPIFRLGLGAKLGNGRQWFSWISIDDICELLLFAAEQREVTGILNGSSPNPVRNVDFSKALARALHRPMLFTVPAFLLKAQLGEFSTELLGSRRVIPRRTESVGFRFRHPDIDTALAAVL